MTVDAEAERIISGFHAAGKPLALCCISPILAAKVLGDKAPTLTLGSSGSEADWPYQGAIEVRRKDGRIENNPNNSILTRLPRVLEPTWSPKLLMKFVLMRTIRL